MTDKRDCSEPFSEVQRLNSLMGGWRFVGVQVMPSGRRRPARQWVVRGSYQGERFVMSRHRTMEEANIAASAEWQRLLAKHDEAQAREAASRTEVTT